MTYSYIFDGSLEGLLTAVFEFFERKSKSGKAVIPPLHTAASWQPDAFNTPLDIHSDPAKASRVWKGLEMKLDREWLRRCYCCFLAEKPAALLHLFAYCIYIFEGGSLENYGLESVRQVAAFARSTEREKHRMEAFIRFEQLNNGLFYAAIEPDFNVLPLIAKHFKDRYADQDWLIYDLSRRYGLQFVGGVLDEVNIVHQPKAATTAALLDEKEPLFAQLWKDYFKSTNIVARKNTRLHVQHVPKRYWKHLTEKLQF